MTTAADLLLRHADDTAPALFFEDDTWSYRDLVQEAQRRVAIRTSLHDPELPPHVGILLDNVPEYLFWLAAAAVSGTVVVGINSTYRGAQLAELITHTDCQLLVTSRSHLRLLDGVSDAMAPDRLLIVDEPDYVARVSATVPAETHAAIEVEDLLLLIFTSGSTGRPKAVRCTQGRLARTGAHVARVAALDAHDVVYTSLPFFHSSSLFTGWSSALTAGIPVATRPRFSASGTLPDIRRYGATFLSYTGKVLNYILAVPEMPDDADNPLRLAIGNEASARDIEEFARRFGCTVRDSYGSTESVIVIRRDPAMPEGALGTAPDTVKIMDASTGRECPPIERGPDGKILNLAAAVGEIVQTRPAASFEGYYNNESATNERARGGRYWSGDLGYRDADGWIFFAGRSNEWLRVDGENFAAAPVEAIIGRYTAVRSVAVYAVPDDPVGDRVMTAVELDNTSSFDPAGFDRFLDQQPDLGTKWVPSFVRITNELPKLASMKLDKTRLRREGWSTGDEIYWRPNRGDALCPLTDADRQRLKQLLRG